MCSVPFAVRLANSAGLRIAFKTSAPSSPAAWPNGPRPHLVCGSLVVSYH